MTNSIRLRNSLILADIALALTLTILISSMLGGNQSLTGFATEDSNNTQDNQNALLENPPSSTNQTPPNHGNSGFLINIITPDDTDSSGPPTQPTSYTPLLSPPQNPPPLQNSEKDRLKSKGGNNWWDNFGNNSNTTNYPPNLKRKLLKMPSRLNIKFNNKLVSEGEEFEGMVRMSLDNENNQTISAFDINFTKDVDLSDIIADSDNQTGKSFIHHSSSDALENIDLYVPVVTGVNTIVVCPGASSYDEIYYGCANQELFYTNDTNNPRLELSADGLYYIVHNITGTGATGVNVTNISSSSQNATPPGEIPAIAGNITELLFPDSSGTTQSWAGYYGNVTGTIQLADNKDNVLYNWTLASPEGEIFASTNNSISWYNLQCFNFTATGTYEDESGNSGGTNLHGTNLTLLENQYNIKSTSMDGVDETFSLIGAGTHNPFYVNYRQFNEGECQNTRIFDSSGTGNNGHFEEALMYEPTTFSVVFASILNEDIMGFDNRTHDFEMIVLEDGHLSDILPTTYYFYAVMF